ncbi:hypothetical protein LSPH24S_08224 [Lysinibacillus sphaericus]
MEQGKASFLRKKRLSRTSSFEIIGTNLIKGLRFVRKEFLKYRGSPMDKNEYISLFHKELRQEVE